MAHDAWRTEVLADPFDPEAELRAFREGLADAGAIAMFTGLVREEGGVGALTLSHYPRYTEKCIGEIVERAKERFGLVSSLVLHRVGRMEPREPIVLVATAALHRRAAFEAADYLMDYLKSAAPFWKLEEREDGSDWIEPTDKDIEDRKRWED